MKLNIELYLKVDFLRSGVGLYTDILLYYIYRPHTNTLNHGTHVKTPNLSHNSTKLNTLGDYRRLINIHNCTVSHRVRS